MGRSMYQTFYDDYYKQNNMIDNNQNQYYICHVILKLATLWIHRAVEVVFLSHLHPRASILPHKSGIVSIGLNLLPALPCT